MQGLKDPEACFTPPPAAVDTLPGGFDRIITLVRPLTSLETWLKTTNKVDANDYDSEEEAQVEEVDADDLDFQNSQQQSSAAQNRIEYPDELLTVGTDETYRVSCIEELWKPFQSGYEFRLARQMLDSNLSKKAIDEFFNEGLARTPPPVNTSREDSVCFTSAYSYSKLLDDLDPDLSTRSWKIMAVDHVGIGLIEFRYRSIEAMIRNIFKQPAHEPYMVYKPVKEYQYSTSSGYRLLSGLHTGE